MKKRNENFEKVISSVVDTLPGQKRRAEAIFLRFCSRTERVLLPGSRQRRHLPTTSASCSSDNSFSTWTWNFFNICFQSHPIFKKRNNIFFTKCSMSLLMSVRRTSFKDSSTYRSVFTACLLFGDWAHVDVLTSITLLSPEWFLGFLLGAIGYISVDNFANFGHRAAPFSASL